MLIILFYVCISLVVMSLVLIAIPGVRKKLAGKGMVVSWYITLLIFLSIQLFSFHGAVMNDPDGFWLRISSMSTKGIVFLAIAFVLILLTNKFRKQG